MTLSEIGRTTSTAPLDESVTLAEYSPISDTVYETRNFPLAEPADCSKGAPEMLNLAASVPSRSAPMLLVKLEPVTSTSIYRVVFSPP